MIILAQPMFAEPMTSSCRHSPSIHLSSSIITGVPTVSSPKKWARNRRRRRRRRRSLRLTGRTEGVLVGEVLLPRQLRPFYPAREAAPFLVVRRRRRVLRLRSRPRPILKTARDATQFSVVGGTIGAVTAEGFAWKYSKSLHGAGMSFAACAVFGWTFGQEIVSHWYQVYRLDTMQVQVKFLEWWKNKTEGY